MKTKVKASLLLGMTLLLMVVLVAPAVAGVGSTSGSNIQKVTLVHYPAGKVFVNAAGAPALVPDNDYYKLLKVKWDVPAGGVQFTLATSEWPSTGVPSVNTVRAAMQASFDVWDAATAATELFADTIEDGGAVGASRDYTNTISFGPVPYKGALAVTTYWYDRRTGRFLETDIEFSTAYRWGIFPGPVGSSTYDVQNVGTHEVGHVVGLADLYRSNYSQLSMYGYAGAGETLKRTLENGDILGTERLYGE